MHFFHTVQQNYKLFLSSFPRCSVFECASVFDAMFGGINFCSRLEEIVDENGNPFNRVGLDEKESATVVVRAPARKYNADEVSKDVMLLDQIGNSLSRYRSLCSERQHPDSSFHEHFNRISSLFNDPSDDPSLARIHNLLQLFTLGATCHFYYLYPLLLANYCEVNSRDRPRRNLFTLNMREWHADERLNLVFHRDRPIDRRPCTASYVFPPTYWNIDPFVYEPMKNCSSSFEPVEFFFSDNIQHDNSLLFMPPLPASRRNFFTAVSFMGDKWGLINQYAQKQMVRACQKVSDAIPSDTCSDIGPVDLSDIFAIKNLEQSEIAKGAADKSNVTLKSVLRGALQHEIEHMDQMQHLAQLFTSRWDRRLSEQQQLFCGETLPTEPLELTCTDEDLHDMCNGLILTPPKQTLYRAPPEVTHGVLPIPTQSPPVQLEKRKNNDREGDYTPSAGVTRANNKIGRFISG